jgi:hypothetical protein
MASRGERVGPEYRPGHLRPARPDQAGNAEDLAVPHVQRHPVEHHRMRVLRVSAARQALDRQRDRPRLRRLAMGEERAHLASDHHADDIVDIGLGHAAAADIVAVAEHGVAIADLEDLLQPMGHEDDAEALVAEVARDAVELVDLARAQRRCRLVHHDQA